MSIYCTGDLHGHHDIERLSGHQWAEGKTLTKNDYLIVAGDFGLVWNVNESGQTEEFWTRWLSERRWTTLFIDGNHENFHRLNALPTEQKFGGTVGKVGESIFHLRRGEVYTIEGKKFWCFGGARSEDKEKRRQYVSWWPEEIPSYAEQHHGLETLQQNGNAVDYIITHTAPPSVVKQLLAHYGSSEFFNQEEYDLPKYLEQIAQTVQFKHWYFGHFHDNVDLGPYTCLYTRIDKVA